jgi:hypothetical protein
MPKKRNDVQQAGNVAGRVTVSAVERAASGRAEALAARLEEGAATLLAFAEGITDADGFRCADDLNLKSLAGETGHFGKFVGGLKSIEDCGQPQVEDPVESQHVDEHGIYDTQDTVYAVDGFYSTRIQDLTQR